MLNISLKLMNILLHVLIHSSNIPLVSIKLIMLLLSQNYFHLHVDAPSLYVVTTVVNNHKIKHNQTAESDLCVFRQLCAEETCRI